MNLLIISDVRIYREGLQNVLTRSEQFCAVEATNSVEVFNFLISKDFDILLLDITIDKALDAINQVTDQFRKVKIMAFGLLNHSDIISYAEAGIAGFVLKNDSTAEMIKSIQRVYLGEFECASKIAGLLLERISKLAKNNTSPYGVESLTPRERQIAELLSKGLSNHEIASLLKIRLTTAKTHVHHILGKLGATRRSQVVLHFKKTCMDYPN